MEWEGFTEIFRGSLRSMYRAWLDSDRRLRLAILIIFLSVLEGPVFFNYAPLYIFDVTGLTGFEWGLIISYFTFLGILLAYPSGKAVDMYGRKPILMVGYVVGIAAIPIFIASRGFIGVFTAVTLYAVSTSMIMPALSAMVTDLTRPEVRGRIFGLSGNLNLLGEAVIAFIAGILYEISPPHPFILIIAINILTLTLIILYLGETRPVTQGSYTSPSQQSS